MEKEREERFLETVRANRERMFRVAMSLLRSGADAEDAVAAAVEATWKGLDRIRKMEALSAYLMRSTLNAARSELRKRKRLIPVETVYNALPAEKEEDTLYEQICGLEEKYRLVLTMRFGEKMTEQEIADALRISRGTVSTRIRRALKLLKEEMEKEEGAHAGKRD